MAQQQDINTNIATMATQSGSASCGAFLIFGIGARNQLGSGGFEGGGLAPSGKGHASQWTTANLGIGGALFPTRGKGLLGLGSKPLNLAINYTELSTPSFGAFHADFQGINDAHSSNILNGIGFNSAQMAVVGPDTYGNTDPTSVSPLEVPDIRAPAVQAPALA